MSATFIQETLDADKRRFAAAMSLSPDNYFAAALAVFPDNATLAMKAATEWPTDPDVLRFKSELVAANAITKDDLIDRLLNPGITREQVEAYKVIATMQGFMAKETAVVVNNNKVLVIRDNGNKEEWAEKAAKQQRDLLTANATRH